MNPSTVLRAAHRTPLIQFIGKRRIPSNIDHTPRPHPQSPTGALPSSFAEYRKVAQQHGPLARNSSTSSVEPRDGVFFDRNQLPKRFWRMTLSEKEIEIIESGGAAAFA